ncbi:hypothetical protein CK203_026034 [Vitis vinifera]|uniref:Retrotransposon Copia-like N-terminal domain-containing protein n=1 Tax=Vitis vinifera TaxID=29760 RepID=A0A438IJ86_VITVI|nr:hypothetical protein CK203_026034 [Vitis vinifera]
MIRLSKALAIKDMSNPFHLHNSDHLGLILVSHHLTRSNYNTWSKAMAVTLTTKNKIGFVDGTIPCVAPIDFLFNAWNHCNNMVTSWILNSILKDIVDSLMYIATTTKI